jgi:hypothetical protein
MRKIQQGQIGVHLAKFIAYYRVSTDKQGVAGLGMDAQRETVARFHRRPWSAGG